MMIDKYERCETISYVNTTKKIAVTLDITTDYLLGNKDNTIKDTELLRQFKEVDNLLDNLKNSLLEVIKAFIRNIKNRQSILYNKKHPRYLQGFCL